MDDIVIHPSLMQYLAEQGLAGPITLERHLQALRTYADGLYESNAQHTLDGLDHEDLAQVPVEVEQEESPDCVVYYLPDHQLIRILPDYAFEIQTWEDIEDEEITGEFDA